MIEIKDNCIVVDGEPVAELLPTHREGTIEGAQLNRQVRSLSKAHQFIYKLTIAVHEGPDETLDALLGQL